MWAWEGAGGLTGVGVRVIWILSRQPMSFIFADEVRLDVSFAVDRTVVNSIVFITELLGVEV